MFMSFIDEAKRKTKCRGKAGCQILKGEQRLAIQVDNPFTKNDPNDTMNQYYCLACSAKKFTADLSAALRNYDGEIANREELEIAIEIGEITGGHEYPAATIAPSGRARCLHSGEKIPKDELRIEVERIVQLPFGPSKSTGYILPRNLKEYVAKGGFDGDDANGELFTDDWGQVVKVLKANSSHLSEEDFKELEKIIGE
jgi:hypothetical protein